MTEKTFKTRLIDTIGEVDLHESAEGYLFATAKGSKDIAGSAWGPAADGTGEWFASRWLTETEAVRVRDRAAAIEYITAGAVDRA